MKELSMGEKIYKLRTEKEMTLEELGDLVGVGKSTVRKWETGLIANMRRDKISKIAKALGCSPAYLMGWEEPSEDVMKAAKAKVRNTKIASLPQPTQDLVNEIIDRLVNLSDEQLRGVIAYIKVLGI